MSGRWLAGLLVLAALAGLGVSIYLTAVHYAGLPLACSGSGVVNCEAVLTSRYGTIGASGVPTAAAGMLWFAASLGLSLLQLVRPDWGLPVRIHQAWSALAMVIVLYLVYIEIDRVGAICAWCTSVHALVLLTLLVTLARGSGAEPDAGRG